MINKYYKVDSSLFDSSLSVEDEMESSFKKLQNDEVILFYSSNELIYMKSWIPSNYILLKIDSLIYIPYTVLIQPPNRA